MVLQHLRPGIGLVFVFHCLGPDQPGHPANHRIFRVNPIGEEKGKISLIQNQKENKAGLIVQPIICAGDAIGSVALVGKSNGEKLGNPERMLVQTAAGFLGRQMEQ